MDQQGKTRPPPAVALVTTGESAFGLPAFRALLKLQAAGRIRLTAVIDAARPSYMHKAARLRRLVLSLARDGALPRTVAAECARSGVAWFVPPGRDVNAAATVSFLRGTEAEIVLVFGCDQILRSPLIRSGARFVNFHNSYLPEYRGVGATSWALLERAEETGFTWHTIDDESIDEGRLVLQRRIPVGKATTAAELGDIVNRSAAAAIPEVIERLRAGTELSPLPKGGRYFSRKQLDEQRVLGLDDSPESIAHRARVLGAVELRGLSPRLRLQEVSLDEGSKASRLSLRIPLRRGAVRVGRINYLPAVASWPLVWMALRRSRSVNGS